MRKIYWYHINYICQQFSWQTRNLKTHTQKKKKKERKRQLILKISNQCFLLSFLFFSFLSSFHLSPFVFSVCMRSFASENVDDSNVCKTIVITEKKAHVEIWNSWICAVLLSYQTPTAPFPRRRLFVYWRHARIRQLKFSENRNLQ